MLVGTVTVAVIALAGCSSGPEVKDATGDTKATKPSADVPSDKEVETFFEDLNSGDPERVEKAIGAAAPDSIAAGYASYHLHILNSWTDAGYPYEPNTLDKTSEGFESCYPETNEEEQPDNPCVVWAGIESEDGKIASLTVNGEDISERLTVGDGKKIEAAPLATVEFLSAYQSVQSNALLVNLTIKSKAKTLSPDFYSAKYRSPDGRQSTASAEATTATDEISPDSLSYVTLGFDRAKPGGDVRLTLNDSNYNTTRTVKIKTR
jgi:hypothetical protein